MQPNIGQATGTVVNRRSRPARFVKITFHVYDSTGARVDDATAVVSDLAAGRRRAFKAVGVLSGGKPGELKSAVADLTGR